MVIDVHMHMGGTNGDDAGPPSQDECYMSKEFKSTLSYYVMLATAGTVTVTTEKVRDLLLTTLRKSKKVDGAVVLAMDAVHDRKGNALFGASRRKRTHLYAPNNVVASMAGEIVGDSGRKKTVYFGASVHPDRGDALGELDRAAGLGAVLVKWIPSSQDIDPLRKKYVPFYKKLAGLGLPLLCHVGPEHTIPNPEKGRAADRRYQMLNHPVRLIPALREGVTVIAAHCAAPLWPTDPDYTDGLIALMHLAKREGWNLFADVSALAMPFPSRMAAVEKVVREVPHDRLVLGSDYPVPAFPLYPGAAGGVDIMEWLRTSLPQNPLDRNVESILAVGFDRSVLTNAENVLPLQ